MKIGQLAELWPQSSRNSGGFESKGWAMGRPIGSGAFIGVFMVHSNKIVVELNKENASFSLWSWSHFTILYSLKEITQY